MHKDKLWERANNFGNSELVEGKRLIENPELKSAILKIQTKYNLPLHIEKNVIFFESPIYTSWMGWEASDKKTKIEKDKRRKKISQEVKELMDKFKIRSVYFGSLFNTILIGDDFPSYQTKGFPTFKYRPNEDGEWVHECIITPETDLKNPLILDTIKQWQAGRIKKPPLPIKNGKVKDWRPVWEWKNRHPDVSDREIAEMLHVNRVTVSRALEKLNKEYATK